MLFGNISADKIQFVLNGKETLIEHGDLEKSIAAFLYEQKDVDKVLLINGPGSFTNLRITTLAFNMYNFLHDNSADFYSIDKLTLFQKLYHKNFLPRYGYIYIGQRKNRRKVDLETMEHETVQIAEHEQQMQESDCFVDQTFEWEGHSNMLSLSWEWDSLVVDYAGQTHAFSIEEMWLEPVKTLEANYMMQPNVTIKSFT